MQTLYSVKEILSFLTEQNITTSYGYDVTHKDVLNGLKIINEKHSSCEWVDYTEPYPKFTYEGYAWLVSVYFDKTKSLIDADIIFFEKLIENYRQICDDENVRYYIQPFIKNDMTYDDLAEFVGRKRSTVKKAFYKLPPLQKNNCYYHNQNKYIASDVCDDLCRKNFKRTYIKYLEKLYLNLKTELLKKGIEVTYE